MKKIVLTLALATTLSMTTMTGADAAEKVHAGEYKVKKGDTLLKVADKYDISTLRLKKWNHLKSDKLKPGKILIVDEKKVKQAQELEVMLDPKVEIVRVKETPEAKITEPAVPGRNHTAEPTITTQEEPVQPATPVTRPHEEEVNSNPQDTDYTDLVSSESVITDLVSSESVETESVVKQTEETPADKAQNKVAQIALKIAANKTYVYGANSSTQVDCSSFAQQVFAAMGKTLPRTTYQQMAVGKRVTSPVAGDLVFFNNGSHVGIYIGNGQMVDALNPREGVKQRAVSYINGSVTGYYRY
ncbi:NlpC/P60 family protein [Macrococcus bovicus]|uniref:NlpC/P60 family protein n=1 Tax=Macrococcus bovicus TaxID=69968 RepID=UPI0025A51B40|nr:NlpC/P60 family protein [Macrococcus bovicus]WJP98317.1 NlpC/P60 family protein [Macrococcus bovicus]